jgi:hypothetical protein
MRNESWELRVALWGLDLGRETRTPRRDSGRGLFVSMLLSFSLALRLR